MRTINLFQLVSRVFADAIGIIFIHGVQRLPICAIAQSGSERTYRYLDIIAERTIAARQRDNVPQYSPVAIVYARFSETAFMVLEISVNNKNDLL